MNWRKAHLTDIQNILLRPGKFFQSIKTESGFSGAFTYLALLSLLDVAIGVLGISFSIPAIYPIATLLPRLSFLEGVPVSLLSFAVPLFIYAVGLGLSFILAAVIHLVTRLIGGIGHFSSAYRATVYAATPSLLFRWIPVVGNILSLYSLYLSVKGISKLYEIRMFVSFVSIILSLGVLGAVAILFLSAWLGF